MEMKVETPMVFEMNNNGAVDSVNKWGVDRQTRRVGVKIITYGWFQL